MFQSLMLAFFRHFILESHGKETEMILVAGTETKVSFDLEECLEH